MSVAPAAAVDTAQIRALLESAELPTADLTPGLLEHFLVIREGASLVAVGGLELSADAALLRSVAVAASRRGRGVGKRMVEALESLAQSRGVGRLYLLTTSADRFFASLGYESAPRETAPQGIRQRPQFSSLCPSTSTLMAKKLQRRVFNVLFLCTGNSARSILAEGILNHSLGRGRFRGFSAGSHPKSEPHPYAIRLLTEHGIPATDLRSKSWDEFARPESPSMDFVITVCDQAAGEQCPFWPGQPISAHWGLPDPAAVEASEEARRKAFSDAFMTLRRRVELFTSLPMGALDRIGLQERMRQIGRQ